MNETTAANQNLTDPLVELRQRLLRMHRTLIDAERVLYEQAHGRTTSNELLQLLINHEQFAWLRSISELIVSIDEAMDADEPLTKESVEFFFARTRALLTVDETGSDFQRRYGAALQREPAAVLAHAEVVKLLKS
jgi:hypothetical protein